MTEFTDLIDLAGRSLGGGVVAANDEFFAAKENLLNPAPAVFKAELFTERGKWMDGWETRRRRQPGHDWAVVRLGEPGVVRGVVVDTAHFKGNYPEECSVEACAVEDYPSAEDLASESVEWVPLVARTPLEGDATNPFPVDLPHRFTHVRLSIYPDGGVARFRVHGEVVSDPRRLDGMSLDLAAMENGGQVVSASDMFFSSRHNLNAPGFPATMGEGWETRRRRDSGNDWAVVQLAAAGHVRQAMVDTTHFKGNAPAACSLQGCDALTADPADPDGWWEMLPRTRLQPDTRHRLAVDGTRRATHVRLDIYPDGGLARLRLHGVLDRSGRLAMALRWLNALPQSQGIAELVACGLDADGARDLLSRRPFDGAEALISAADAVGAGNSGRLRQLLEGTRGTEVSA